MLQLKRYPFAAILALFTLCYSVQLVAEPIAQGTQWNFNAGPRYPAASQQSLHAGMHANGPRFGKPTPRGYQGYDWRNRQPMQPRLPTTAQPRYLRPGQSFTYIPGNEPLNPVNRLGYPLIDFSVPPASKRSFPRVSSEFEPQRAILLSVCDWQSHHNDILVDLVAKTAGHTDLIILCNDAQQMRTTAQLLVSNKVPTAHVLFKVFELDTVWLRDFGPRMAEGSGADRAPVSLDFAYEGSRPRDDSFPQRWAEQSRADVSQVPWTLQGGNLLCNGSGLGIASVRIFADNYIRFSSRVPGENPEVARRKIVAEGFLKHCNLHELVILEPLRHESTRHVDMFATFLAKDHILIADVDPRVDPENARVLDWNAERMAQVRIDGKRMRVDRIQIPNRIGNIWSPYTNIIMTDDLILMPFFDSDPPKVIRNAVRTYQRLLPGRQVKTVDMSSMKKLQGSLHCMSVNLPKFVPLPSGLISLDRVLGREQVAQSASSTGLTSQAAPGLQPDSDPQVANRSADSGFSTSGTTGDTARTQHGNPGSSSLKIENRRPSIPPVDPRLSKILASYRRTFTDVESKRRLAAYVCGVNRQTCRLVRAEQRDVVDVSLSRLTLDDQEWLLRNAPIINRNGQRVMTLLTGQGRGE